MMYRHCDTSKSDILNFIVQVNNEVLSSKPKNQQPFAFYANALSIELFRTLRFTIFKNVIDEQVNVYSSKTNFKT